MLPPVTVCRPIPPNGSKLKTILSLMTVILTFYRKGKAEPGYLEALELFLKQDHAAAFLLTSSFHNAILHSSTQNFMGFICRLTQFLSVSWQAAGG